MKALGVDLGSKRIGIAVSDAGGVLASPVTVLQRSGSRGTDHRRIAELAYEEEADCIVVGVPVALSGRNEVAATAVLDEVAELRSSTDLSIETWDERMTTAAAHKALASQAKSARQRREVVDKWAAANILQGWLDRQRSERF